MMSDPFTLKWAVQDGYLTQQQIDATISESAKRLIPRNRVCYKGKEWEDRKLL